MATTSPSVLTWLPPRRHEQPQPFHFLKFRLDGDLLEPAELPRLRLPEELDAVRCHGLLFSGKGPVWLYVHLMQLAHEFAWVACYDPRHGGGIVVRRRAEAPSLGTRIPYVEDGTNPPPPASLLPAVPPRLIWGPPPSASPAVYTLRLEHPGIDAFDPAHLPALAVPPLPSGPAPEILRLSGRFPVWLAGYLFGVLRERYPEAALAFYNPHLAGAVVCAAGRSGGLLGQVQPDPPRACPVPTIALVGDPNSGKSVLAWKLCHELERRQRQVYRFDGDAAAPTTAWSLGGSVGVELRQQYKRERGDWRPEDVDNLVRQARLLRQSVLEVLLLDLPGGLHKKVPQPIRIPDDGRAELFRLADGFVILERDAAAAAGWHAALGELGMADRILARVQPAPGVDAAEVCPSGPHVPGKVPCWTIHGLDRKLVNQSSAGVHSLVDHLLATLVR